MIHYFLILFFDSSNHQMGSTSVIGVLENDGGIHFSGLHLDGLEAQNSREATAKATDREPFVIG